MFKKNKQAVEQAQLNDILKTIKDIKKSVDEWGKYIDHKEAMKVREFSRRFSINKK